MENKCVLCGNELKGGIIIREKRICRLCEKKIINTKVDSEEYDILINKIKDIVFPSGI